MRGASAYGLPGAPHKGWIVPRTVTEYRCLLISPSDVERERDALLDVVAMWNAHVGKALDARVELVRWETHAVPDSGQAAQASLNRRIVDQCDFGIAIFWARLGTPTGSEQSGSIEEINRLKARGANVLVYFNAAPVPQEALQDDQFDRLQAFKQELDQSALFSSYNGLGNLREQVMLHVTTTIARMLQADRAQPPPVAVTPEVVAQPAEAPARPAVSSTGPGVVTAPKPDVRIEVRVGVAGVPHLLPRPGLRPQVVLAVVVQNYSPQVVYIGNIVLELRSGRHLLFPRDAVTGELQRRRALQPGEDFNFMMAPDEIFKLADTDNLLCALVIDAIGREYRSSQESMKQALDDIARSKPGPA
jgi:hypothetical protein